MAIQRINYHTGLFLEEVEFKIEQNYHMLMRRRINYALFTPGVLYRLGLHYDGNSSLIVDPGMAIDQYSYTDPETGIQEDMSREIIVLEPYNQTDLSSFTNGDEVWITIKYDKKLTVPKALTPTASRVTEGFIIETHPSDPFAGDEKILLGKITIGTALDAEPTQKVTLRLGGVPPSLISIAIVPAAPSILENSTVQLTATGTRSDQSIVNLTGTATWTSNNGAVATVDAQGLVTGRADGSADIAAESETITGTATVTVTAVVTLVSIEITPDPIEINEGEQVQLTATGYYSDTTKSDLTGTAKWNSTDPAIASFVDPVNSPGLLKGSGAGSAQINATAEGQTDIVNVTVSVIAPPPVFRGFKSPGFGNPGATCGILGESLGYQPVKVSFSPLPVDPQQHGINATINSVTNTGIECVVPTGAKTGPVRISTAGGWGDSTVDWGVPG